MNENDDVYSEHLRKVIIQVTEDCYGHGNLIIEKFNTNGFNNDLYFMEIKLSKNNNSDYTIDTILKIYNVIKMTIGELDLLKIYFIGDNSLIQTLIDIAAVNNVSFQANQLNKS